MEKKKILFVIDSLDCGGAEKSLVTLLKFIDFSNFEIDLQLHSRGGLFEKLVPPEVTVRAVQLSSGVGHLKYTLARAHFLFLRVLNKNKQKHNSQLYWQSFKNCHLAVEKSYDIAIGYGQGFSTYFVADKVIATTKYTWLNNDYIKAGYNLQFDIPFYNQFHKIVVVSDENERVFQQYLKSVNKELPTVVIRDIVDEIEISKKAQVEIELVKDESVITVVTVGRLTNQKGLSLAIAACKILIDSGKKIVWYAVGEGEERAALTELIAQNGLQEQFILLGLKANPYPYVKIADIYVQSSISEGLCITLIEARLLQKPIVTTNFPSAYGIIKHNETGLICEMDAVAIAKSIAKYIDDVDFRDRISSNLALEQNADKEESLCQFAQLTQI